jgi:hypothetical protein
VCIDARERGQASPARVADLAAKGEPSIKRFEVGKTWPAAALEDYAAAYAEVDPESVNAWDIYDRALDWWKEHGNVPLAPGAAGATEAGDEREPTAQDVMQAISQAREKARSSKRVETGSRPNATRRKRAG